MDKQLGVLSSVEILPKLFRHSMIDKVVFRASSLIPNESTEVQIIINHNQAALIQDFFKDLTVYKVKNDKDSKL